jgi:hypothetical protein
MELLLLNQRERRIEQKDRFSQILHLKRSSGALSNKSSPETCVRLLLPDCMQHDPDPDPKVNEIQPHICREPLSLSLSLFFFLFVSYFQKS